MGGKNTPNTHEEQLFARAEKYIDTIKNIRGIKMIGICNSLSMYATNRNSDIDLFIVTEKNMLWYVRFFVTLKFWILGVWRKWDDIAGNFCLSFFVSENALEFEKITISDDIYLYFWIYFLRPILDYDDTYEKFLQKNNWVNIDEIVKYDNKKYIKFSWKSHKIFWFHSILNIFIKFFGEKKTKRNYEKMGRPTGVIISDDMLKFHDKDQRENIRDNFFGGEKRYKKGF